VVIRPFLMRNINALNAIVSILKMIDIKISHEFTIKILV